MTDGSIHHLDLALPANKKQSNIAVLKSTLGSPLPVQNHVGSTYAIGSSKPDDMVYYKEDLGLFQTIYEAWKNHWNLRTRPDDWWFCVVCRIAKAIDKAAKHEARHHSERDTNQEGQTVRDFFVNHQGKKAIKVDCPVYTIYEVDCESFFESMAGQIEGNVNVPEFAKLMQCDFSTSHVPQKIASQINLMASVQEFFEYHMGICGCGIKGVEMFGEQQDWDRLVTKWKQVRVLLEPIQWKLGLYKNWFDHVEKVFENLAKTFAATETSDATVNLGKGKGVAAAPIDDELSQFWSDILIDGKGILYYGPSGMSRKEVEEYNGWLIMFLTGDKRLIKEHFNSSKTKEKLSGLNTVPIKVSLTYLKPPVTDNADLLAGIMGFRVYNGKNGDTFNSVPSLEANHMWAMQLPSDSALRRK